MARPFSFRIVAAAAAVAAASIAAPAASQVLISPVVVEMAAAGRPVVVSVTLSEKATAPVRLQAQLLTWRQDLQGRAVTEPSDDLLIAPRIAELKPGQRQIFRLAWRQRPPTREMAYRLILEDVEAPKSPEAAASEFGVRFRMRYDLAVLVAPQASAVTALRWSPCADRDAACVRLENAGTHRIKLTTLTAGNASAQRELGFRDGTNLLAGAVREWRFPAGAPDAPFQWTRVRTVSGATVEATRGD